MVSHFKFIEGAIFISRARFDITRALHFHFLKEWTRWEIPLLNHCLGEWSCSNLQHPNLICQENNVRIQWEDKENTSLTGESMLCTHCALHHYQKNKTILTFLPESLVRNICLIGYKTMRCHPMMHKGPFPHIGLLTPLDPTHPPPTPPILPIPMHIWLLEVVMKSRQLSCHSLKLDPSKSKPSLCCAL